ncbi:endo-1,4-beta-xylanase [Halalkalicoccus tibetensis]|uniref:endo-1,4-beta-xylanase n=1 Tax=Halalkalicoccus tibetensis TaxID=175632 RepID=A0ABD5V8N5_9EURY
MREENIDHSAGSDGDVSGLDRRLFLGMLGALGAGGSLSGVAGADDGGEPGDDWEAAADDRIHEHRTAELEVSIADGDGDAVETEVDVEMLEHEFTFGTAVDANRLQEEGEDADRYREVVTELFNTAVLENHHKWRFWEDDQELADEATEWVLEEGLDIRGHAALWAAVDSWAVPPDVVSAMGVEWEDNDVTDPEFDPEHVEERSFEHLETIIEHYGEDMLHWDVVNEVIHEPEMIQAIDGEDVDPVEAPVLAEWYRTATEVAPEAVDLDVNDYNTLAGPYEDTRDDYERQIEFLANEEGADLDGVGMQCHFSEAETLTPEQTMEGLDRYTGYGADLRITEFDMADEEWDEKEKAEFFEGFLRTIFSHPDVEDFLMWGFWDDEHWLDDAPLFFEDWEEKPSYDVYTDLVFGEWWTDESGTTADGSGSFEPFLGEHELTISFEDGEFRTELSITDSDGESVEVVVADVDVRGAAGGRRQGTLPVHVSGGEAFDPRTLDPQTIRFGTPEAVDTGEGATPRSEELSGGRNGCMIHFDAGESTLEGGVAMLHGRTEDGKLVVGFERY